MAGWYRVDSKLRADLNGRTAAENDLPPTYGAGVQWRVGGQAILAGTATWRNWGSVHATPDAHNTFNWSLGAELGSGSAPLRFGARGGQLPFAVGTAPTEGGVLGGLGLQFPGRRGPPHIGNQRPQPKRAVLTEPVVSVPPG